MSYILHPSVTTGARFKQGLFLILENVCVASIKNLLKEAYKIKHVHVTIIFDKETEWPPLEHWQASQAEKKYVVDVWQIHSDRAKLRTT